MADNELLQQIAQDIALVKQALMGGPGLKGANQRLSDIEEWKETHPRVCPLPDHIGETVDNPKERRVNGWNIFAILVGSVGGIGGVVSLVNSLKVAAK
jgi:hypothetical protein